MRQISRRQFHRGSLACGLVALHSVHSTRTFGFESDGASKLRRSFQGELIFASSPAYEGARNSWNRRYDRHPMLIAQCRNADDALRALEYAEREKLPIAVRSGGHSVGALSSCDGGVVIDLGRMDSVRVDEKSRVLVAQPGARIGQAQAAARAKGLVANLPSSTSIGVGGAVLAAGVGDLYEQFGNAGQALRGAACLLADGRRMQAERTDPDGLLWGLRGAGANLAIATELTIQLFEPPLRYEFSAVCPTEAVGEMLHRTERATDEVEGFLNGAVTAYGSEGKPMVMIVSGSFKGSESEGKAVLAKLVQGIKGTTVEGKLKSFEPDTKLDPPTGRHFAVTRWATNAGPFRDEALAELFRADTSQPFQRFVTLNFAKGPGIGEQSGKGAFAARKPGIDLGIWADASDEKSGEAATEWMSKLWSLAGGGRCGGYPSLLLPEEGAERLEATYGDSLTRLRELKAKYDPKNVLRNNLNVTPS